jgi:hypothetical protein
MHLDRMSTKTSFLTPGLVYELLRLVFLILHVSVVKSRPRRTPDLTAAMSPASFGAVR